MSIKTDPALYGSNFERLPSDRYWTESWVTNILMRRLATRAARADLEGVVWEPAAGRGDMVRVLLDHGAEVFASDVDLSEFDGGLCDFMQHDFMSGDFDPAVLGISKLITNPPYRNVEDFVRRALAYEDIRLVAMLLRAEFSHANRRTDLFELSSFAFEIKLTTRPRWDWWFRDKPKASPRHNFSWFVWDRGWSGAPTTYWDGKNRRDD